MNDIFKALNDPTRREIIRLLRNKNLTAGEIADHFAISKPSISHHLDLLKRAELVSVEKKGQFMLYSINATVLEELLGWILSLSPKKSKK